MAQGFDRPIPARRDLTRWDYRLPFGYTNATMRVPFLEAVKQRLLLGDGAMGTQLIEAGLPVGGCGAESL